MDKLSQSEAESQLFAQTTGLKELLNFIGKTLHLPRAHIKNQYLKVSNELFHEK